MPIPNRFCKYWGEGGYNPTRGLNRGDRISIYVYRKEMMGDECVHYARLDPACYPKISTNTITTASQTPYSSTSQTTQTVYDTASKETQTVPVAEAEAETQAPEPQQISVITSTQT